MHSSPVLISGEDLTIDELVDVAKASRSVQLSEESKELIQKGREMVQQFVEEERVVYGITTGVGENSKIKISTADSKQLQKNLIMSHACGVGDLLDQEQVRAIMLMMVKNLSHGHSGVRLETVEKLIELLNHNVIPVVPSEGSLGYLIYQSHISLVLMGMGEAIVNGERIDGDQALKLAGIEPIELYEKEGLSLINGTVDMTALGALAIDRTMNLLKTADVISMLSFEAVKGTKYAYDPRLNKVKPHPGQEKTTDNIHEIIRGSEIAEKYKDYRTQDALSIRSIPQVHGASKDAVDYAKTVVEREMNAATDNPLLFEEDGGGVAISSSNCHGEAVSMAMDFLAIAIAEIGNISERRTYRLITSEMSDLPSNLIEKNGLHSGYMIPQYVAASLVSNNKVDAHPNSVDSITTTGGQEDHVSMGTSAALKALQTIYKTEKIVGIELLNGAQGIDLLKESKLGAGTQVAYDQLRQYVPKLVEDRVLYKEMDRAISLVSDGTILGEVEEKIGHLNV
ncbi:histidine ammonia-lyase [Pontibacillus sp. HMF3514]|uniref:histidine ammonia-lyase n=1 Tax=Pontibacillus sp. HMF3514 TaxID=2692425 RepID=UPI00131F7E24|nr:histidine ammonia-lyase [Pontibacillus sp. HMF3514]QHE51665.1 histidine ammonia-lyase [Pontibacillus sp. HMF3514]